MCDLLYFESEDLLSPRKPLVVDQLVEDLFGRGSAHSYLPFLLILLVSCISFSVHALNGQVVSPNLQLATPLQTTNQTIQQATQACLTPSPADFSTVQMQATSTNGTIAGNVVPEVRASKAMQKGTIRGDFALHFELVFKLRNPDGFSKCLASVSDPSSANYGHFLNVTMLQPYLPTPGQKASIVSFLSRMGMSVAHGASPLVLEVSASVGTVEKSFGVRMNLYEKNSKFRFYAADSDPIMPQNFASIVGGIVGLENYTQPRPAEYPCSGPYCPQGIQVGYALSSLHGNGYEGTGQRVAIVDVPGDPNVQTTINTYSSQYGLAQTTLDIRYPDGLPSSYDSRWAVETALDVEAVHTVAPGATIVLLYDQINLMNAIEYVAANHLATIVSNSWVYTCGSGTCSDTQLPSSWVSSVDSRLGVLAAQGLTLLFASGDNGAKPDGANFGTEFPASDRNVLAVGGTNLALSGCGYTTCSGYASETGASIGGGGYSGYFAEPSWQTSTIGTRPGRAVPDVSMLGQNPYFWTYLTGSGWFGVYGTSLSTPLWAGFLAIALQIKGVGSFGNLGPRLYQVASSSSYSSLFHDVISGSNGYSAGQGWDPVTGWGTPVASALAPVLANPFVSTDKTTYVQLELIHFTGAGFTPGGSVSSCLSTDNDGSLLCVGQPNADGQGNVAGTMQVGTSIPVGPQKFMGWDASTGTYSNAVQLTITSASTVTVTVTRTLTESSTSYLYRTTTTTTTSCTSTYTSTSTIPTSTTVVLVPLTITSTAQSTQFLTSFLTTTVTSYTGTTTSTSTIPTTVALLPLTVTSTAQSTQYLTSTLTTTVTSYTSTETSTSTIPTLTTVVLVPSTVTSTVQSTQYLSSTLTTTVTSYTDTTTSTSASVVYTTVTVNPTGAGAGVSSSPLVYLGFLSLLAVTVGHRVTATNGWRIPRSRRVRRCSNS